MKFTRLFSSRVFKKNGAVIVARLVKQVYHQVGLNGNKPKQLVFVLGCQRSGTTMLVQCLEKDLRTKSYGQYGLMDEVANTEDLLYSDARGPRLKPFDEMANIIAQEKAPLLIFKPLRESQNALSLLDYFTGSKVIWVYRSYRDVANSHLVKWGDGVGLRKLRPIYDGASSEHWAAEGVSPHTRQIIREYFSETMAPIDAAALYWYSRSILFFDMGLDKNPSALLCKYEDIVTEPDQVMRRIYRFFDYGYPGDRIIRHIHQRSVNRGKHLNLSPEIEALCDDLLHRLDQANAAQAAAYAAEPGLAVLSAAE